MEFTLNLTAERSVARESLKGVLWTIFFSRLFGPIVPTTNEFLDIPYPMAADVPDIDSMIDQKVDQLIKSAFPLAQEPEPVTGSMLVVFSQKDSPKAKKRSGWFGQAKDHDAAATTPWETWLIRVKCLPVPPESAGAAQAGAVNSAERLLQLSAESFETNVSEVMALVNKHKDHIPPIMTLDVLPFPCEIVVGGDKAKPDDDSWGHYIKKFMD